MNLVTVIIFLVSIVLVSVLGGVGYVLQNRTVVGREKASAYECGFDPNMSARIPFSLRFFLLAVIFLVLDVEIAMLMGVPISMSMGGTATTLSASIFLIVLVIGLLHEWREGSLNWM